MKFDYAATTPLVTETLGSDFVGLESSGAEFLPALHRKKIKKPPRGQSDPDYKSSIRGATSPVSKAASRNRSS